MKLTGNNLKTKLRDHEDKITLKTAWEIKPNIIDILETKVRDPKLTANIERPITYLINTLL